MAAKMKSLSRFSGLLGRSKSVSTRQPSNASSSNTPPNLPNTSADSPEANVTRTIRLFCESGNSSTGGEEVLHLPAIVEAAESSPSAASAAAQQIRKFLSRDYSSRPHVQYNAIMLIRILCDNPGPTFTKCFDKAFVSTVKELLRGCRDGSTQQILRETLDALEANKQFQEGMEGLVGMWRKEKGQQARLSQGGYGYGGNRGPAPLQQGNGYGQGGAFVPQNGDVYGQSTQQQQYMPQQSQQPQRSYSSHRQLPAPIELASRIEEARNTAKILLQLIQSTPAEEVLNNELTREFADRCQSAQRSMQGYIGCDSPPPDDDTMLTLIETNEQLSLASTRYQRSILSARKALGLSPSPSQNANGPAYNGSGPYVPPQLPSLAPEPASTQGESLFAGPDSPLPQRQMNEGAFPSSNDDNDDDYHPPPGPPPAMLARLNSRDGQQTSSPTRYDSSRNSQPPRLPSLDHQSGSDPFADPVEHDRNQVPFAYRTPPQQQQQQQRRSQHGTDYEHPARRPHSQAFSIDAGGPEYLPPSSPLRNTTLDQAPASPSRRTAPTTYFSRGQDGMLANGMARQGQGQVGGGGGDGVQEIDGHSEVGRTSATTSGPVPDSPYDVSPVETRYGR